MLRAFGRAMLAPFRHPGAALLAAVLIVGAPLALIIGADLLAFGAFSETSFFTPEGGGDPVLLQHLIWFGGHPETMRLAIAASVVVFGPLAYAIWWRALENAEGRLHIGTVGRVAVWLWLALSVFLLSGVFFAGMPVSSPAADTLIWFVVAVMALVLLTRFQPRISDALGGPETARPGWALCLGCAVIIVLFGLAIQTLALLAWVGVMGAGPRGYTFPDSGAAIWITRLRLLDWQQIFMALAFAYTALVTVAFLRRPRLLQTEG